MDLTAWWSTWQTHRQRIMYAFLGLLLFLTGWQVGRVTSPYTAQQPIVFTDTVANNLDEEGSGSTAALVALREQGQQLAQAERGELKATVAPTVAAAATVAPSSEPAAVDTTENKLFVASVNSDLYHHRDCPAVKQIKKSNQVWFSSAAEAEAAGYLPSKCTQETKP